MPAVEPEHKHDSSAASKTPRRSFVLAVLAIVLLLFFLISLNLGSAKIPFSDVLSILAGVPARQASWDRIVLNIRLTRSLTAILVGAALAVAGLQMQTLFRNPLADPFILGINSGASLGVAVALLAMGTGGSLLMSGLGLVGDLSLAIAASIGAGLVLALILVVGRWIKNPTTLLIMGLMFGHATGAVVSLLIYFSSPERIQAYTIWSYGSFGGVTWNQMRVLFPGIMLGLGLACLLPKALNALLLGDDYAKTMGLNLQRARFFILLSASLLAGISTAFCGPIGFLGVAIPHLARNLFKTADHKFLVPTVAFLGAIAALIADGIAQLPGTSLGLPINVVTSFFGAPFVLWMISRRRRGGMSFTL
jgi:iron complex transport system permease protein